MRRRLAQRHHRSPAAKSAGPAAPARPASQSLASGPAGHGLLNLQRAVGNQAVQRRLAQQRDTRAPIQRESLDSRVQPAQVDAVDAKPVVKERKVTYKQEKKSIHSGFGDTVSKVVIDYSVDEEGKVTVGAFRPEYVVTTYTPVVESGDFVEKFGPIMETLWDKFGGNMQAFSESHEVRNFPYEPQTLRHENMHVAIRQLALKDILPDYLGYLKRTGSLNSVSAFLDATDMYMRVAWNDLCEKIMPHERMHYLDAVTMVEEYRHRADEEPKKPKGILDMLQDAFTG